MGKHYQELKDLPSWPAALSREIAASYVSLSPNRFDEYVRPHLREIHFGRSIRFNRKEIDNLIEWLAGEAGRKAAEEALEQL